MLNSFGEYNEVCVYVVWIRFRYKTVKSNMHYTYTNEIEDSPSRMYNERKIKFNLTNNTIHRKASEWKIHLFVK